MATVKEMLDQSEGHQNLIKDLDDLKAMAEAGKFHDFATDEATPKVLLNKMFLGLADNVVKGRYDD